jgi:hypothetical protein
MRHDSAAVLRSPFSLHIRKVYKDTLLLQRVEREPAVARRRSLPFIYGPNGKNVIT